MEPDAGIEPEPWAVDLFSTVAFLEETKKEAALWEARVAAIAETCGADLAGSTTGADLPPDLAGRGGQETAEETAEASWKGFGTAMEAARLERLTLPDDAPRAARIIAERMRSSRPVVLTNLAALAGFAPEANWTAAQLENRWGDRIVRASISPSGRFDGPEPGALWGLPPSAEVLVRPPETHLRLRDLLALLRQQTPESFYVEYNALHQYLGESLAPLPAHAAELRHLLTNVWLGRGATTSPLHYDEYENLLTQLVGTKELVLFPPEDLPKLYYEARPKGTLRYSWPNAFTRVPISASERSTRVVFASSVDVSSPDLSRHPRYGGATPFRCTLRAGETLLMPAFWHHEVYSRAAPKGGLNVAINFWFRNETSPPEGFL